MSTNTTTTASLVRMANQIAANYRHHPPETAKGEVADHVRMFWAGPMLSDLFSYVDGGGPDLDPVVIGAVARLRATPS